MSAQSTIQIENNDRKIWHRDKILLDLLQAAMTHEIIDIDLNSEAPCAESLGLYAILDDICARTNFDKSKITIWTANLIESHQHYKIKIVPQLQYLNDLQAKRRLAGQALDKDVSSITKHFGHFVGHSSRARLAIASWLYHYHRSKAYQTFHSVPTSEFHREFLSLEDLWFHNYGIEHVDHAVEFLKHVPFSYDNHSLKPILHHEPYGILGAYYNIFVDIACTTFVTGNSFYLDEKIWRPIMTKTPFIVHGPRNFLKNLRLLGFKTFDRWWDEGYSEDPPDMQVKQIIDIIDHIATWDMHKIQRIYEEMRPVLDHNLRVFETLKSKDFLQPTWHR